MYRLNQVETRVQGDLQPLLDGLGVPADVNFLTTAFNADFTGMDMVLEVLDISIFVFEVTVTNGWTGTSYTEDFTTEADDAGAGFPASDEADTLTVKNDNDLIRQGYQVLTDMFAVSRPIDQDLANFINTYFADDYLDDGHYKVWELNDWLSGGGPEVGMTLISVIDKPMDVTGTGYQKGYWIRECYRSSTIVMN